MDSYLIHGKNRKGILSPSCKSRSTLNRIINYSLKEKGHAPGLRYLLHAISDGASNSWKPNCKTLPYMKGDWSTAFRFLVSTLALSLWPKNYEVTHCDSIHRKDWQHLPALGHTADTQQVQPPPARKGRISKSKEPNSKTVLTAKESINRRWWKTGHSLPLKGMTFSGRRHWHPKEQQDWSCTLAPRFSSNLQGLSFAIPTLGTAHSHQNLLSLTQSLGPLHLRTTLMFITAVITAPLEIRLIHSWRN